MSSATLSSTEATPPDRRADALRWLPWAAALAAPLALGPLLFDIVGRLWESPRFGHAPLIWAAAAGIGWYRWREERDQRQLDREAGHAVEEATRPRTAVEAGLWALTLLTAIGAVWLDTPWLALVATFLAVPAATYSLAGWTTLRPILPAWAVVWTTLPPPFKWDERLVLSLQQVAADLASTALDLLGRRHLPAGVTVELPERRYFVEEACSGVNSLYALLAVTALALAWGRRGWPRWLILLPAAVVWAVAANAVRVTAAVELSAGYGWPVAEGLGHDLLGVVTFVLAAGLTLSTDTLLALIVPPRASRTARREDEDEGPVEKVGRFRLPALPRPAVWGTVAGVMLLAAGWQLVGSAREPAAIAAVDVPETLKPTAEDSLPAEWNGWLRIGYREIIRERGHIDGTYSAVWSYRRGPLRAEISMDGPFTDGWHDLEICYTNSGWNCTDAVDRVIAEEKRADGAPGDVFTRLDLEQPLGRRGVVFFTSYAMDDDENLGPDLSARTTLTSRFEAFRDFAALSQERDWAREPGYQVQVYAPTYRPLSETETEAVEELFHEMRGRLAALPQAAGDVDESEPSA